MEGGLGPTLFKSLRSDQRPPSNSPSLTLEARPGVRDSRYGPADEIQHAGGLALPTVPWTVATKRISSLNLFRGWKTYL